MSEHERFRHHALYGRADGEWAILQVPDGGPMIPPRIGDMRYMGSATEAVLKLWLQVSQAAARLPAQEMIARLAGVAQTTVSLHVRGGHKVPSLSDEGWRALVRVLHAWTEWPDKPCDEAAVAEFLATGDRIKAEAGA